MQASSDLQFDFLILAADGAGKHAINLYLNLHPRVFSVRAHEIEQVLQSHYLQSVKSIFGERALLASVYSQFDELSDLSKAAAVKKCVKRSPLIQIVRDPIRMMLSLYNQRAQRSLIDNSKQPHPPEQYFETMVPKTQYYTAGSNLAEHFSKWIVLDTVDISGQKTPAAFRFILETLGVEADDSLYQRPELLERQNDVGQSIVRRIRLRFDCLGVQFHCKFQLPHRLDHHLPKAIGDSPAVEWMNRQLSAPEGSKSGVYGYGQIVGTIHPLPDDIRNFLKCESIDVITEESDWTRIDSKLREFIKAENTIGNLLGSNPSVLEELYGKIRAAISYKPLTVDDIGSETLGRIKLALADDVRHLFRVAPELREKWDICGDIS